jgi:hypothetical protein
VFHMDVAKVDQDVAYAAMVCTLYCKCLFPLFHLFFRPCMCVYRDVAYVSHVCCKCRLSECLQQCITETELSF